MSHDTYVTPFEARYASREMLFVFSDTFKFRTWRKLWIALAEEEQKLGIPIEDAQLDEMRAHAEDIDFDYAKEKENELRHDVMAHVHTFAHAAPKASPIIHLGATSAFVGDNTDLIQIREALTLVEKKLYTVILELSAFAEKTKAIPTLGFTHYQPAQPTTVGKRATLWLQDLVDDFHAFERIRTNMRFRGVKGTTGTQASFLSLFEGDSEKVALLDKALSERFGFAARYPVTGQTYTRRFDSEVGKALALFSEDAHKLATDIRLLQSMKEVEEPFGKKQIGSSAMAYKRNPMRSERICSLARFVIGVVHSLEMTTATQWFERTLDDSANKRLTIPQAFLAVDSMLEILMNVTRGFVVNEKVIERNLLRELPFMATETILMEAVKKGGDRQHVHERIRVHSHTTAREIKEEGKENNLLASLADDPDIPLSHEEIARVVDAKAFIGLSVPQVEAFIAEVIAPLREAYSAFYHNDGGALSV